MTKPTTPHAPTHRARRTYDNGPLNVEIEIIPAAPDEREHLALLQARVVREVLQVAYAAQHDTRPPRPGTDIAQPLNRTETDHHTPLQHEKDHHRTARLDVRLTPNEHHLLYTAAATSGQTISDLVRTAAIHHANTLLHDTRPGAFY